MPETFAQFGSGTTGRPIMVVGDRVSVSRREMSWAPMRPGSVVSITRGAYGFDLMVTAIVEHDGSRFYRGEVTAVRGEVPCA